MKTTQEVAERYPKILETVDYFNREESFAFWEGNVSGLSIVEAAPDVLTWEFKVEEKHCNQLGNLHGGCVATLIDICSSFAIIVSTGAPWKLVGISTDLSITYLRGVAEGDTIRIVCDVQRVGRTLANMFTKIYDSQNRICYSGSHTKFNIDSKL
ncbi:HotDog domain-containing protein [Pilaira anomala]|nr:HotDog domain-containing protein [Pilaira anomala]